MKKVRKIQALPYRFMGSHYYISLLMFLIALGLVPVSLNTSETAAGAERAVAREEVVVAPAESTGTVENVAVEATEIALATEVSEGQISGAGEESQNIETVENQTVESGSVTGAAEVETPASQATEVVESYPIAEQVVAPVVTPAVAPVVTPADQINIAGNTVPIFRSTDTLIDAGNQAGLYGKYFIYGHNISNVFGGLSSLGVGARFTVTLDGVTKVYQILGSDLQTKSYFEGYEESTTVAVAGAKISSRGVKMMKAITAYGRYQGKYYDYISMTCAGTSYGNGDASHRLVLLASEV